MTGGKAFSRGALYNILRNPIYVGKVRHKEELHDGLHEAIIDEVTWQSVLRQLANHGGKKMEAVRRAVKRSLDGLLFDATGRVMRTTYASKSRNGAGATKTRRYWYYTSKPTGVADEAIIERLPAMQIERLVLSSLKDHLNDKAWLMDQITAAAAADAPVAAILLAADAMQKQLVADVVKIQPDTLDRNIDRIDSRRDRLHIQIRLDALLEKQADCDPIFARKETPFQKRQNGRANPILIAPKDAPQPDDNLIAIAADARRWAGELLDESAASIRDIDSREGLRSGTVSRILPLAWLAPDISAAILEGCQPADLTAKSLRALPGLPLDWEDQRRILGFRHQ